MLDALDPTNRDAKGLPFTVRAWKYSLGPLPKIEYCCRSEQSSSLTQRRSSVLQSPTPHQLAVTSTRSSESSTPCSLVTSTESRPLLTGSRVRTSSSTRVCRTKRPRLCSRNLPFTRFVLSDCFAKWLSHELFAAIPQDYTVEGLSVRQAPLVLYVFVRK